MFKQSEQEKAARKMIRKFDKKLLAAREYDSWIYKLPLLGLEGFCLLISLWAVWEKDDILLYLLAFGNGECIRWQLMGYMQFQGQSVYKLLRYCPVTRKDILGVRLGYLRNMMLRRAIIWSFVQFLMGMHFPKLQGQSVKMVVMFLGIGTLYNLFMIMGNQGKTEQEETTWERKNLH